MEGAKELLCAEAEELDNAIRVIDLSLSRLNWRLKAASRTRLNTDVLALCSGMRPVIMVDYGGKLPELRDRLCALLKLIQKECCIFEHLRVLMVEDMIYLVHTRGLALHIQSSLSSETPLLFVDLEQDPPKLITRLEETALGMQLLSVQKLFSLSFPVHESGKDDSQSLQCTDGIVSSQSPEFIDLSTCLQDTEITVPTLNGWLLGYPVVYAFGKDHIADAIYNLSSQPLHLFKISVCRNSATGKRSQVEELLSFSVPYDLSMGGSNEQWAKAYLCHMEMKWERCKQVWRSLTMDVAECYPQAIVL